jgi:hypothetical protein
MRNTRRILLINKISNLKDLLKTIRDKKIIESLKYEIFLLNLKLKFN